MHAACLSLFVCRLMQEYEGFRDSKVRQASVAFKAAQDGQEQLDHLDLWDSLVRLDCLDALDCVESPDFEALPDSLDILVPLDPPVRKHLCLLYTVLQS